VGLFGGKRTKERENDHYESTLDNLINLASKDCLEKKKNRETPKPAEEPQEAALAEPKAAKPPVKLVDVLADDQSPQSMTTVILAVGEGIVSGVSARMGGSTMQSVAAAAGRALEHAYPESQLKIEDIQMSEGQTGQKIVTVSGKVTDREGTRQVSSAVALGSDLYSSVAEATVGAFLS
jgi:RNA-splicing ligase RtcB